MAKGNNYQTYSQIDYCIHQYFSKYMASTLMKEKKLIESNQAKELYKALEQQSKIYAGEYSDPLMRAKNIVDTTGKWNKMTVDDLVNRCEQKWSKDKRLQNDYNTFVAAFYSNLVAQNGGKESKKLWDYANSYVYNRFQTLIIEQLAREKVPRNTASYIAKKTYSMFKLQSQTRGELTSLVDEMVGNEKVVQAFEV